MPFSNPVRGALFRVCSVWFSLCCVLVPLKLSGQQPDYDIGAWVGGDFDLNARRFFSALTLQTSLGGMPSPSSAHRMGVGLLVAGGTSLGEGNPGIIPAVYGYYGVTSNLVLNGLTSGFVSDKDVVILTRYGLNYKLSPEDGNSWRWMVQVLLGTLQGPDDFFLKTVDAGLARRINYQGWEGWVGLGLNTFEAGIHIRNTDPQLSLSKQMRGQVNAISFGIRRPLAAGFEGSFEGSLGPSALALMIGIHKLIG